MCINYKMIKLIGITGKKFSGKDTLGKNFVEAHCFKRLAFADALKSACKSIFGFTDEQLYGNEKEIEDSFWKTTPRAVLQYVGTELFRNQLNVIMPHVKNNIWVDVVKKQILDVWKVNPHACFVITDVRFPNEIAMIKELGGCMIRVKREKVANECDSHSSEAGIDDLVVDMEVLNNGTIEELYTSAENKLEKLNYKF